MSTPDNSHFGQILPVVPYPPTFSSDKTPLMFGDGSATALNFIPANNFVLAPHGSPIWQGSADQLAALVRDARRFRRLEAAHANTINPHSSPQADEECCWAAFMAHVPAWCGGPVTKPLAEIADALPEVES